MVTITFPTYESYMMAAAATQHLASVPPAGSDTTLSDATIQASEVMNKPLKDALKGEGDPALISAALKAVTVAGQQQ